MTGYHARLHRVYLVDDHDIVRRGVRDLLVAARDVDVVGDAGSVREAVPAILRLEPDVVLLDLHLGDGSGIEICRRVRAVKSDIAGLLLTAAGDDEAAAATVLAGAAGYLVKVTRSGHVLDAIRSIGPGEDLMDADDRVRGAQVLWSVADAVTPPLADVERQALELLVAGHTDDQITDAMAGEHGPDADIEALVARVTQALLRRAASA